MDKSSRRARSYGWKAWLCGVVLVGAGLIGVPAAAASNVATPAVPGAPKITVVTPGNHSVTIAFTKPSANGGPRVMSYRATCTSSNGGLPGSHQTLSSPIIVGALTGSKTYRCTVVAITKVSVGPPSAPSAAVVTLPTVPGVPTITTLTSGFHSVTVAFKPSTTGGAPITNYRVSCTIYYSTRTHQSFESPITIACAEGAETYTCTVAAENRVGWSHTSSPSNGISLPITPGAPTISSVTPGIRSATIAVTPPANDGGVRIAQYRATCTSSNGGVAGSHQAFNSPITVAGLSAGDTYTCAVAAINQVSTGPPSAPSSSFVPLSN